MGFLTKYFKRSGPGILLAAAGVGAGDCIAAAVAGAAHGLSLGWALLLGAIFKFYLNEGMAKFQIETGMTFMEGFHNVSKFFTWYFLAYLVIWTFIVGGALTSGVAVVSGGTIPAILIALATFLFMIGGKYKVFSRIMKAFAFAMFICFSISAILVFPPFLVLLKGLFIPTFITMEWFKILALIGGVGGTVTIMAYSYWIQEEQMDNINHIRWDLAVGYFITFFFGLCVMIVAAAILNPVGGVVAGKAGILALGKSLSAVVGPVGYWSFILGFGAAIVSSLCSYYQAIPYLFADAVRILRGRKLTGDLKKTGSYLGFQWYCLASSMVLLWLKKPVLLIMSYSVLGAFFMPFLAILLLWLNKSRNGWTTTLILFGSLVLMTIISLFKFI